MATVGTAIRSSELIAAEALLAVAMPKLRLGISLQPRWPIDDGRAVLRAARHAEALGFDHVAVGNRLLDSGSGLASAAFLTPPGFPAAVPSPGRPLGGQEPTAFSVADGLNELAEAGLASCTLWLPVAAEHLECAMDWIAEGVMPRLD